MNNQVILALLAAVALMVISFSAVGKSAFKTADHPTITQEASAAPATQSSASPSADVYSLGPELIRPDKGFAFSFEFVSILLLSALVGAIVIARKDPS
jgi:NADH:ubiquinone oxidoreductase subunit 6 (subunit J)